MSFISAPKTKWRVRNTPQLSANQIADYMSGSERNRETIIRDAKFQSTVVVTYHEPAADAIDRFLANPVRNWRVIHDAIANLQAQADEPGVKPKSRERLLNNVEALTAFENNYNSLGLGGLKLQVIHGRQPKTMVEGVKISVNLSFMVSGSISKQPLQIGGLLLDLSKRSPPKTDAAKARAASFARHATTLVHMHVAEHMKASGTPWFKLCMWADVQGGELHVAQRDYKTVGSNIAAACRAIVRAWDDIDPPPGFDPRYAKSVP